MSPPMITEPPGPADDTGELPAVTIVTKGAATLAMAQALHRCVVAHRDLEALCMAVSRQLDAEAT